MQEKQADQDGRSSWPGPVAGGWGYDPYYRQSFPYSQYWPNHPGPYPPPDVQRSQNELESFSPHSPPSTPRSTNNYGDSRVGSRSSSPVTDDDTGCNKPEYSGNKQVSTCHTKRFQWALFGSVYMYCVVCMHMHAFVCVCVRLCVCVLLLCAYRYHNVVIGSNSLVDTELNLSLA